jgi:MFS family permease
MSAIMTAVHFLPLSVAGGTVVMTNGLLPERFRLKWRIVSGGVGAIVGSLLLAFASEERFYWPLVFPGFAVGSGSMALLWVSCYVALMLSVPRRRSGVAGAVFNSSLQLGCSVGLSIATAIQVSYPARGTGGTTGRPITPSWRGYQISLFFVLATVAIIPLLTLVFFRDPTVSEPAADKEVGVREKGTPASA